MRSVTANIKFLTSAIVLCVLLASCVSKTKYDELAATKSRADRENLRLKQVEKDYLQLLDDAEAMRIALSDSSASLALMRQRIANLDNARTALQAQYDDLLDRNNALLSSASEEKQELTALLTQKQQQLDAKERELTLLGKTLSTREEELALREERIAALSAQLDAQQESLRSLKTSISDALLGFSAADLTVEQKDGKIYVSLSQNLLFEKNSKRVDAAGKQALAKLAEVLKTTDVGITVEGHTDTDGTAVYNWDLSVTRATAVVNELTSNGLDGSRITAAGRAFYQPLDPGESEEAKSRNRRTEIILAPKLTKLLDLINE